MHHEGVKDLTAVCRAYLDSGAAAPTMSTDDLVSHMVEAGIGGGDAFASLVELNELLGGRRIRDRSERDRAIFHTIGVPSDFRFTDQSAAFVEFFDFGVAAPCEVGLNRAGSVVADFGLGAEPLEVAESFEIFLEGQAREMLAAVTYDHDVRAEVPGSIDDLLAVLPEEERVAEVCDRWTTWWHGEAYLARLSTLWNAARTPQLAVWTDRKVPSSFARLIGNDQASRDPRRAERGPSPGWWCS